MAKFPEWVDSWKEQYEEEAECEVLKADIRMVMRKSNGEIIIRSSEYESKNMPKIELNKTPQGSIPICG
ncbi:MAG: hypothetical protein P9X22_08820 [Candidatus Zapsychrus exili]|nr:hypothetical protein [Candidatus Zapsychrus exili]